MHALQPVTAERRCARHWTQRPAAFVPLPRGCALLCGHRAAVADMTQARSAYDPLLDLPAVPTTTLPSCTRCTASSCGLTSRACVQAAMPCKHTAGLGTMPCQHAKQARMSAWRHHHIHGRVRGPSSLPLHSCNAGQRPIACRNTCQVCRRPATQSTNTPCLALHSELRAHMHVRVRACMSGAVQRAGLH